MPAMKLESCTFALFGALGDLALRKLIPGLYRAHREGSLPANARIIPTCRNTQMVAEYKDKVRAAAEKHLNADEFVAAEWDDFAQRLFPVFVDMYFAGIGQQAIPSESIRHSSPSSGVGINRILRYFVFISVVFRWLMGAGK